MNKPFDDLSEQNIAYGLGIGSDQRTSRFAPTQTLHRPCASGVLGAWASGATVAALVALLAGCAAPEQDVDDTSEPGETAASEEQNLAPEEDIGSVQANLDSSWVRGPFVWNQGSADVYLASASTHVCVLTRLKGDFDGGGEKVLVYQANGSWYLGGTSKQSGIGGVAYCYAMSAFVSPNVNGRWHDVDWSVQQYGTGTAYESSAPFLGDAATFINGFAGRLQYAGDQVYIAHSSGPYTPNTGYAQMGRSGAVARNYFMSFWAGTGPGVLAKYWNNATYRVDSSYRCVSSYGNYEVAMAPVNDAMCVFTQIGNGGNWDGGAEYVDIYPKTAGGVETWYLRAHSGYCDGSRKTVAEARCFKRDQR
jgi:hypothetical protein